MYPTRDFKYLISQPDVSDKTLITALRREPFTEILSNWNDKFLNIYQTAIEEAISKERYPLYQLDDLRFFPGLIPSALNGLKKLWTSLRFSLKDNSLLIDSIKGQDINMNPEEKLKILETIPYKMKVILKIDDQDSNIGLFPSKRAERIYRLVNMLESIVQDF